MGTRKPLVIILVAIVVLIAIFLLCNRQQKSTMASINLPGMQTSTAPWAPEIDHLSTRLQALGLPEMKAESNVFHIHQHLDIFIYGQKISVPANIGINGTEQYFSPIHTHDTKGIIHIESAVAQIFTLGQFFDIWGVRLASDCIGGYCNDGTNTLRVYSNGSLINADPRTFALTPHQEIVIAYGAQSELPQQIPSSYTFPPGD